jgi:hypothetical protein
VSAAAPITARSCATLADMEALAAAHDEIVFAEPVMKHGHMWFRIIAVIDGEEYEDTHLTPKAAWADVQRQAWQAERSRRAADEAVAGLAAYFATVNAGHKAYARERRA